MFDAKLMVSKSGFDIVRVRLQTNRKTIQKTKYNVMFLCQHSMFLLFFHITHRVSAMQLLKQSEVGSFGKSTLLIHKCQQAKFLSVREGKHYVTPSAL